MRVRLGMFDPPTLLMDYNGLGEADLRALPCPCASAHLRTLRTSAPSSPAHLRTHLTRAPSQDRSRCFLAEASLRQYSAASSEKRNYIEPLSRRDLFHVASVVGAITSSWLPRLNGKGRLEPWCAMGNPVRVRGSGRKTQRANRRRADVGAGTPASTALNRRAAASGMVLLKNGPAEAGGKPLLPLDARSLQGRRGSVLVAGPTAGARG